MAPLATLLESTQTLAWSGFSVLSEWSAWLLTQPPPTGGSGGGGGGGGAAAGGASGAPQGLGGCGEFGMMPMLIAMLVMMYFVLWRPEQKRAKEREAMLGSLKKGAIVRTNSGIKGEIVRFENDNKEVILEIAPKTRINVLRGGIAGVAGTDAAKAAEEPAAAGSNKK